jgi:hypothetical protein
MFWLSRVNLASRGRRRSEGEGGLKEKGRSENLSK